MPLLKPQRIRTRQGAFLTSPCLRLLGPVPLGCSCFEVFRDKWFEFVVNELFDRVADHLFVVVQEDV